MRRLLLGQNLGYRHGMRKLEERVAIVTGGGRGIGRAIASKLAADGARVVLNDLDEEPARAAVEELRARGDRTPRRRGQDGERPGA